MRTMIAFRATFFIGLLCACHAALPDVGRCTFMEYFCDALKCNTGFTKAIQKDPYTDCSAKFQTLLSCVVKTSTYCAGHRLSQNQIWSVVRKNYHEHDFCMDGGFKTQAGQPGSSLPCTSRFTQNAALCGKTFHEKFVANRSDPALCSELAKAKKCLKDLIASNCTHFGSAQELLDLSLSDYNPFCANNRDPGATGNDQCFGIPTLTPPVNFLFDGNPGKGSPGAGGGGPPNEESSATNPPKNESNSAGHTNHIYPTIMSLILCLVLMRFF